MPVLPISLTDGYVPVIQLHDSVHIGQVLATRTKPTELSVSIAQKLELHPKKVVHYLLKNPGDTVHPGDEVAAKKNMFGKTQSAVVSTIEGIVTRYDRETGTLYIRPSNQTDQQETIISPIEGTITLCNNEKILIETDKHFITGKQGSGDQISETLIYVHQNNSDAVQSYELDARTIGKIVIGKYFPRELLIKSISMDIGGVIGTKFLEEDLQYLKSKQSTMPILEVEEDDLAKLKHWDGKRAFMHGEGKTVILLHT